MNQLKTSKKLRELAILAPGWTALSACNGPQQEQDDEKQEDPNILFVMVDDMGYSDIGIYGQESYATPNLA